MMVLASLPCFQTLIDTRKSETIAEATEPPSSADEVSRKGQRDCSSRQSTLSRHASMDNLQQRSSPTRAGQQYARHGQQHRTGNGLYATASVTTAETSLGFLMVF